MERKLFGSIQNWIKIKIQLSDIFETQTDKNWLNAWPSCITVSPPIELGHFRRQVPKTRETDGHLVRFDHEHRAVHRESTNPAKLYNLNERLHYFSCMQEMVPQ